MLCECGVCICGVYAYDVCDRVSLCLCRMCMWSMWYVYSCDCVYLVCVNVTVCVYMVCMRGICEKGCARECVCAREGVCESMCAVCESV